MADKASGAGGGNKARRQLQVGRRWHSPAIHHTHDDSTTLAPTPVPMVPVAHLSSVSGQVVNLGAGLDGRAFRLAFPPHTTVFEVDRPEVRGAT